MNFDFIVKSTRALWVKETTEKQTVLDDYAGSGMLTVQSPAKQSLFNVKFIEKSLETLSSLVPNTKKELRTQPINTDKQLPRTYRAVDVRFSPRFRPYVAKVPWHNGPRAFLSMLFPRYGHYCGPNWSSGKDGGSMIWDKRPIDWLDFCCYCHDIGYDTHDQSELLKSDLAFLECLEKQHMKTKGNIDVANLYKAMCITGLKTILIPYRRQLLKIREDHPLPLWLHDLNSFLRTHLKF